MRLVIFFRVGLFIPLDFIIFIFIFNNILIGLVVGSLRCQWDFFALAAFLISFSIYIKFYFIIITDSIFKKI